MYRNITNLYNTDISKIIYIEQWKQRVQVTGIVEKFLSNKEKIDRMISDRKSNKGEKHGKVLQSES